MVVVTEVFAIRSSSVGSASRLFCLAGTTPIRDCGGVLVAGKCGFGAFKRRARQGARSGCGHDGVGDRHVDGAGYLPDKRGAAVQGVELGVEVDRNRNGDRQIEVGQVLGDGGGQRLAVVGELGPLLSLEAVPECLYSGQRVVDRLFFRGWGVGFSASARMAA